MMPALLTTMLAGPSSSSIVAAAALSAFASVTSTPYAAALAPDAVSSPTIASSRSMRRAINATVAPALARARAVWAPIPLDAPVITATLPLRSIEGLRLGMFGPFVRADGLPEPLSEGERAASWVEGVGAHDPRRAGIWCDDVNGGAATARAGDLYGGPAVERGCESPDDGPPAAGHHARRQQADDPVPGADVGGVEVARAPDAAVDVPPAADRHRRVDRRNGAGSRDGVDDRCRGSSR